MWGWRSGGGGRKAEGRIGDRVLDLVGALERLACENRAEGRVRRLALLGVVSMCLFLDGFSEGGTDLMLSTRAQALLRMLRS